MVKNPTYEELEQRIRDLEDKIVRGKLAEEKLRENEEKYRTLLDDIEEGYFECDLRGNFIRFNNAWLNMIGYTRDEMIGQSYKEIMDEETAKYVYRAFNKIFRTAGHEKTLEFDIIRKDSNKRTWEHSVVLIRDKEGHRIGFRGINRDITDRKTAQIEKERYRQNLEAIFRSVKDAIITVDNDMKVIEANTAAKTICGLSPDEITGRIITDCPNKCIKSCYSVLKETLREKKTVRDYRIECQHHNNPRHIVVVTASPLLDQDETFNGAVLVMRDETKLRNLERELRERHHFANIIGKSKSMQDIYSLLEDLADIETTVLVTGESGTGKELVAKALHYISNRAYKPLIKVNCSALAENLLESELFGHVKGAFTGAIRDKQGRFQAANGGTILLDEIGDISPRIQLKLLRVLEEKEFERVGESLPIKVDVRVIANTNRDLKKGVRVGEFREDLYYRLKVFEIALPPLRDRLDDVPLLVDHFCNLFNKKFDKNIKGVSDGVFKLFMNYSWPGNIRELEHTMERAFVLCREKTITSEDMPPEIREHSKIQRHFSEKKLVDGPQEILEALGKTGWNKAKAARLLGINRRTIYRKISKYQLQTPSEFM